jgi:hypothetical protein
MSNHFPRKSIGALFPAKKTKLRSPDMLGPITIQDVFLRTALEECNSNGEVVCNLAGWFYRKEGKLYMSIELSPPYRPKADHVTEPKGSNGMTVDQFFQEIERDQE